MNLLLAVVVGGQGAHPWVLTMGAGQPRDRQQSLGTRGDLPSLAQGTVPKGRFLLQEHPSSAWLVLIPA